MLLVQISAFVGGLAFAWIVFQYVGYVYSKNNKLTIPAVVAETLVFCVHGVLGYIFLNWRGTGPKASDASLGIGAILVAVGLVATVAAMRNLGWSATFGQGTGEEEAGVRPVAIGGLYQYSRNPQLIAYLVFLIGCVLLWPAWGGIAWLAMYVAIGLLMVRTEEKHLKEQHPEEYKRYTDDVPRWFGMRRETSYFD
jgi:protein-S-isoprenylcysteine O-methyltransferase Ste14